MKVLMIDNYDSFVYTLVGYVKRLGHDVLVYRNDEVALQDIVEMAYDAIIISPGPGTPYDAGVSMDVVKNLYDKVPMLGVCLGHQVMGAVFGCHVGRALYPLHGEASLIEHKGTSLFKGIASPCAVGRYHSLVVHGVDEGGVLEVLARTEEGEVMALRHKVYPMFGVQFHPESLLTQDGMTMLKNFFIEAKGISHGMA